MEKNTKINQGPIPDQLLANWFTKSLIPPIARDVAMGGVVTYEKAISHAEYLDLVHSHSGTLYDLSPHAPRPTTDPSRPVAEPPTDGILASVQTQTMEKSSKKQNQTTTPSNQPAPSAKNAPSPVAFVEVNAIQSTESSSRKKKGKNKSKKPNNQQEGNKTQNSDADSKGK